MKSTLLVGLSALAILLVSCARENANLSRTYSLEDAVIDISADFTNKNIKKAWEEGDRINIWFDDHYSQDTPDLVLSYDGAFWTKADVRGDATVSTSGTLCALYETSNDLGAMYKDKTSTSSIYSGNNSAEDTNIKCTPMLLAANACSYSYDPGTTKLSSHIESWEYITRFKVVVTGLSADAASHVLKVFLPDKGGAVACPFDQFGPKKGENSSAAAISGTTSSSTCYAGGVRESDGVAFYFRGISIDIDDKVYFGLRSKDASEKLYLVSAKNAIEESAGNCKSIKLPFATFSEIIDGGIAVESVGEGGDLEFEDAYSLLSFSLKDGESVFPSFTFAEDVISVCVPEETDLQHLTAVFKTNAYSVTVDGVPQISGSNVVDFSTPVQYVVSSKGGGDSNTYTVKVYPFNLPTLCVSTPGLAKIESKEIWVQDCVAELLEPGDNITDLGGTSIKGRGNSTWTMYDKKPYTLKLNSKSKILGMPKDKRWNLLANAPDPTNLRNSVGFYLAKQAESLKWTPNGHHVELILNGEHKGLYYLCEHIKVSKDRVNINEMNPTDITGEAVTGGYLLEFDEMYDEVNKFRTDSCNLPVMIKEPDEAGLVQEQFTYIKDYVNDVESCIVSSPINMRYKELIDLESFAEYFLVKEMTFNTEMSNPRSVYMHKDKNGKLTMGPVWDFDLDPFYLKWKAFNNKKGIWYGYLFKDPEFNKLVKDKWQELKPKFQTAKDFIQNIRGTIKVSADRDNQMWPIRESFLWYNIDYDKSFDEAVDMMINGLDERIEWIDANIESL